MQTDEVIWSVLDGTFCGFKKKEITRNFCRNEYNVSGLCNRVSCPLANSNYGTIIEHEGICYLYLKTIERAHTPRFLWEKIELSKNFEEALARIDKEMQGVYPGHQICRIKQRLTRLRQTLIRSRNLIKNPKPDMVPIRKKTERREKTREAKAERAAKVDLVIEKELLSRLKQGTYGDIYNFQTEKEAEQETDVGVEEEFEEEFDDVEDVDLEELMDAEARGNVRYLGSDESDNERSHHKKARRPRLEIEYEDNLDIEQH
eukprot:GHVL01044374.1.p1 GENE.GHVL01044374.1~~GHVL01044374.1.p1  ORF type:complete len:260 (+),score=42.64 GHVL01044374.1:35-814(+)